MKTLTEPIAAAKNVASPYFTTLASPIGELFLAGDGDRLHALHMETRHASGEPFAGRVRNGDAFKPVLEQLDAYFAGRLTDFDVPLDASGTEFRKRVWDALSEIPFGETRSYGEIAARVGNAKASRAVGLANGANPIAVIVPCHRVIGADGTLTGFGGGLERKQWLLSHEQTVLRAQA
ncbi:MAG: methylated-DNA--[protein]-cysteine S-methyltransferase [Solirubrobacterales bacterium]